MSRRKTKCGRCKHCAGIAYHRCRWCKGWLCVNERAPCGKLRKVPGELGRYDLVCTRGCRKTRSDIGIPKKALPALEQIARAGEVKQLVDAAIARHFQ